MATNAAVPLPQRCDDDSYPLSAPTGRGGHIDRRANAPRVQD